MLLRFYFVNIKIILLVYRINKLYILIMFFFILVKYFRFKLTISIINDNIDNLLSLRVV